MSQPLRALAAVAEDPSLDSSIHMRAHRDLYFQFQQNLSTFHTFSGSYLNMIYMNSHKYID